MWKPVLESLEGRALLSGYTFTRIGGTGTGDPPSINSAGDVAFLARPVTTGLITVFRGDGVSLTTIAAAANGLGEDSPVNRSGTIAFRDANSQAIYTGDGGPPTFVATTGFQPALNDGGTVAFRRGGFLDSTSGVYTVRAGTETTVADNATVDAATLDPRVTLNDGGTVAFKGTLIGDRYGIYTGSGGPVSKIIDSGPDRYFINFGTVFQVPDINDSGAVAFVGGRSAAAGGGGAVAKVVGGTLSIVAESPFPNAFGTYGPAINNVGTVAFYTSASGGGIYTNDGVTTSPVIRFGDALDGSTLSIALFSQNGLNDAGQIAFYAELADGRAGIYRANPILPTLSIGDVTVLEGNAGTTGAMFTITLSAASTQTVTVSYATADGTATTADNDYVSQSGTATFAPGETSTTIIVAVHGDTTYEPDETFSVILSHPSHATIATGTGTGTGTITNDDPQPSISINSVAAFEGNSGTTPFGFTVSLSNLSSQTITVDVATGGGTATPGTDYVSMSGTLTFAPGAMSLPITVQVDGDTTDEENENFFVSLSNPVNATIAAGTGTGTGTILNEDSPPQLSIDSVARTEGNGGTTTFPFTVSLSQASGKPVTVSYATADGTATAGSDYQGASATLSFAPGETTKTIDVRVIGDTLVEPDETFLVNLLTVTNATIAAGQGTGTILNDDAQTAVSLSIDSVSRPEGNAGTTPFTFTVRLSAAATSTVTVNYATANGTASAAGKNPDYSKVSGTLTFAPGEVSNMITVPVNGDTLVESDETFFVNLSGAAHAAIARGTGTGTILNDDAPPTVSIRDVAQLEGNCGTTPFVFTVTLSAPSATTVTVKYATTDGTATAHGRNSDYTKVSGTLTFNPGVTTRTILVLVNGDTLVEPDETFFVNLSAPNGATIGVGQATGTILNDDGRARQASATMRVASQDAAVSTGPARTTSTISPRSGSRRTGLVRTVGLHHGAPSVPPGLGATFTPSVRAPRLAGIEGLHGSPQPAKRRASRPPLWNGHRFGPVGRASRLTNRAATDPAAESDFRMTPTEKNRHWPG